MMERDALNKCSSCGHQGTGNYCSNCGQSFETHRISLQGLLHDILHLFTHLEKGFLFTLKQLFVAPGHMQRSYVEGKRDIYQKPFSMFFICATITAISRYWIINGLMQYYHFNIDPEAKFFHEYMVITYTALVPLYALIAYLVFFNSKYNYAEMGVLMLYTVSVFYLMSDLITLARFAWPYLDTRLIEFPVFSLYFIITLLNFFKALPWWEIAIKGLITMALAFFITQVTEWIVVRTIS